MELPNALHRATPAELKERIEAERRERPFLLYRDGDGVQRIIDLGEMPERLTIGRSAASGLALPWDSEVSRVHASLERIDEEWTFVEDGSSRNGSFIDGERVHGRRRLREGDAIQLGRSIIVYRSPTGRESLRTMTSQARVAPAITDAQRRVLVALCRPYKDTELATPATNQQIADELVVSVDAVKSNLRALFAVFGVDDLPQNQKRASLALQALRAGVVTRRDL